ncbi:hypothetical protein CH289_09990 [Rhodococcus sp. RS1C4]|nr:hypothetical protein CH289_09990 [Rhodococcus sp. RS1C4]
MTERHIRSLTRSTLAAPVGATGWDGVPDTFEIGGLPLFVEVSGNPLHRACTNAGFAPLTEANVTFGHSK